MTDLLQTLKTNFGYNSFRPLQKEIMEAALADRDVFALLPTGGGKSLCFQIPALHRTGLTVVVSPLIALMKDQVDQLQAIGIAATFLNSSLGAVESRSRLAGLHRGEWKLLYVSPERLLLDEWKENLKSWNIQAIAIDEAHCISEWGHDFRPEYRMLSRLRELLPGVPVMALTATATEQVRKDIVAHLKLDNPATFAASFNRPNLSYRVIDKDQPLRQIVDFVKRREDESGIVYCSSRAATEKLAESLKSRGYLAAPYHAGLPAAQRGQNQELFLRDEIRIICATIAFGMGINKPNVRWVIHYDLPKNLAGYYQETGRAGRDGLPGDCLLLFSRGDAVKHTHFIDEIKDEKERAVAKAQLYQVVDYAENNACRRSWLLNYFGERFPFENCAACDNCSDPKETYDATIIAQKILSCVYRIRQATRFSVGMQHIVDVITGADTERIRKWGHDTLSTYAIGGELTAPGWLSAGRELLRLGYLKQAEGEYPTIELSEEGLELLKNRTPISLTKQPLKTKSRKTVPRVGELACDELLYGRLKTLRKKLADQKGVPAYVIFGDATLRQLAREYPCSVDEMQNIFGMGEKKRAEFGETFSATIKDFLDNNSRMSFVS